MQDKGVLPPDKPKLNRKKFIDEAREEWNGRSSDCFIWEHYLMDAISYMLCQREGMSSRASLEAVGAAKVLKLAIRLREFSEEVREKGEHEYKLVDQYNYIKDILDVLSDEHYGKKDLFVIDRKSGINTIAEVNSSWGIKNPFFFQKKVFYWGTKEEQKEIYVLEEGETILSLNKYGDLWEAETIAIPWIHHSQEVEVQHSKYSGIVTVEKTIVRSDDTGAVHMYIYFAGGEKDV